MKEKNIKGLLIDDNADDTMTLMELLAQPTWPSFTFSFECAGDLKTGLEQLSRGGVEVVLLDLNLPDSKGIETVRRVHAQAPHVPIVVLTGTQDETVGLEAVRNGAQDYQVKGNISGHALKRTISYTVERFRLLASIQNIIGNTPDGLAIIDARNMVRYINPAAAAFFGGNAAELLKKPFPWPLPDGAFGEVKLSAGSGAERTAELRVAIIDWHDEPARLVTIRDITELRWNARLQAEIFEHQKLDKLKDEFIGVLTHELRSPLTIIKGVTDTLMEGDAGPLSKEQSEMLSIQAESIMRMEKGVRCMMELSRLESSRARITLARMNAAQLLQEIAHTFRLILDRRNIPLQLEVEPGLPDVCSDPELFVQILSNLLDNAIRFTRTRITVRARPVSAAPEAPGRPAPSGNGAAPEQQYVQFSVIDDGPGIPAEHIPELFNKYVQVTRIAKGADYRGMGLGLAICKESIERQNGRIWAESPPGSGAMLHFLLPRYELGAARQLEEAKGR